MREPNFTKWLLYTVGVGALPTLISALSYYLTKGNTSLFNSMDLIAFGLVVHVSMINEIEDVDIEENILRTTYNGISILFLTVYGFLIACGRNLISNVSEDRLLFLSQVLSVVSLVMGFSLYLYLRFGRSQNG